MHKNKLYALDFDGVICDSAVETGITGWRAAGEIWSEMQGKTPSASSIEQFRQIRPVIETGYEAILAMRLLFNLTPTTAILANFSTLKQQMLAESGRSQDYLKQLFGDVRDNWIKKLPDEWIAMNPLFPNVAKKLNALNQQEPWQVITTKQERFVSKILAANGIDLAEENIFGLDRNMGKVSVLTELIAQYPQADIHFVEDRLPTLIAVLASEQLKAVLVYFAIWGYNTSQDKQQAQNLKITPLELKDFLV